MREITEEDIRAALKLVRLRYRGIDFDGEGEAMVGLVCAAREWDPSRDTAARGGAAWPALRRWRVLERVRKAFLRHINEPVLVSMEEEGASGGTLRARVAAQSEQPSCESIDEMKFLASLVSGTKRRKLVYGVWVLGLSVQDAAVRAGATSESAYSLLSQAYDQVRDRLLHRRSDLRHWRYRNRDAGAAGEDEPVPDSERAGEVA